MIKGLLEQRQFLALCFRFLLPEGSPFALGWQLLLLLCHKEHLQIGFSPVCRLWTPTR